MSPNRGTCLHQAGDVSCWSDLGIVSLTESGQHGRPILDEVLTGLRCRNAWYVPRDTSDVGYCWHNLQSKIGTGNFARGFSRNFSQHTAPSVFSCCYVEAVHWLYCQWYISDTCSAFEWTLVIVSVETDCWFFAQLSIDWKLNVLRKWVYALYISFYLGLVLLRWTHHAPKISRQHNDLRWELWCHWLFDKIIHFTAHTPSPHVTYTVDALQYLRWSRIWHVCACVYSTLEGRSEKIGSIPGTCWYTFVGCVDNHCW